MDHRRIPNLILALVVIVSLLIGARGATFAAVSTKEATESAATREVAVQDERTTAPAAPNPATDETKIPHYFGPNPNWANSPFTLPDVVVTISPSGTPVSVGNSLTADRGLATDNDPSVFVVDTAAPLPAGALSAFQTWAQAGSGTHSFNAYVLRPDPAVVGGYTVVFDSGPLVVLDTATGVQTFNLAAPFAVQAGDVIAHYGQGIPVDIGLGGGQDLVIYPATTAPIVGTPINVAVGSAEFPLCGVTCSDRTYSLAASLYPGSGATATATVGANGTITGITITNPGSGYTAATVSITDAAGTNTSATADAVVTGTGAVTAINMDVVAGVTQTGSGYTAPVVTVSGGGATTDATATANGGVDAVAIVSGGANYTNPTVEFDAPDDPNGTTARGHATLDALGAVTDIVVDDPGSGYYTAPNVRVYNGTLFDPIACQLAAAAAARAYMMESNDTGRFAAEVLTETAVDPSGAIVGAAPAAPTSSADCGATATTTLKVVSVTVDTFGAGYTSDPTVSFSDAVGSGTGASATATTDIGAVTAINLTAGGSDYVTSGGIKKFVDGLPGLCDPNVPGSCPDWIADPAAKAIPVGVPAKIKYNGVMSDQYEIGLVQYQSSFSSSLPPTLSRGYVQLKPCTGAPSDYHLTNTLLGGGTVDTGYCGWTPPQWLGPVIAATKDLPVRIIFRNLLPTGSGGDLIIPTDSTLMGSGMADVPMYDPQDLGTVTDEARNPLCTQYPKSSMCFKDNRATLHMHGGITPWISDGTPHQWITPAGESTAWPQGVSVSNVPDMAASGCDGTTDGCMTFYYTNQQSARLLFYHDHAWGITRLGVYVGGAAGYLISDDTEQALITNDVIPGAAASIPLVIQDRTFVPQDTQMYNQYDADGNITSYGQDPTWDASRWGGYGSFWFHHVYMPAQNPGDPSGMSGYGRWMYGPWFWPPAGATKFGPIANPYFGKDPKGPDGKRGTADDWTSDLATACNLDDPATWQYDTDPFCEPELIPGTPNISTGMEQFNDTPIVNGVAYPTVTLEPKTYRFRVLNAANDRFFNFQWYVGDPATASTSLNANGDVIGATEVALNPAELAAAQTDPVVFPTPVQGAATAGPDWIQIGTEGGFLPAPVVVDGQQPTTWVTDPTRFDVGNVDLHSLLLAPAERADVIVDFSKFAGKTLILYNDGPAAFPARVPSYDYYTGAPDLSPVGAPAILPGYGPNTRTIMQVKIAGTPAPAFNLTKLRNAFSHKANGTGVFESGQHPIIVGQAAYNLAYGTRFPGGSNCNVPINTVTTTLPSCDGFVRVNDTSLFGFNTLKAPATRMVMPLEPKAIHDEMNSTTFDEWGRMQATLGIEAQPPTPGVQNVTLYPYVNPQTELIDATNLPKNDVTWDAGTGLPVSDVKITPIANAADGSQIWRITHNGVDTHPIHFHLYDVQVLNRVTWDNIIIPAEPTELGWKDTVRVSPLEDTIVALRPIIPELPWELPNAIRNLSPMMSTGSTQYFNNIDPQGNPTAAITNTLVNFGWEYVYHCHILTHEEMDMMRPVSVAMPPVTPSGLAAQVVQVGSAMKVTLTWNDNSIAETSHLIQRRSGTGAWTSVGTVASPLNVTNTTGSRTFDDATGLQGGTYDYRVVAQNEVGYQDGAGPGGFPSTIATATSNVVSGVVVPLAAPTDLTATYAFAAITLSWTDNTGTENGFAIERAVGAGAFAPLTTVAANVTTFVDTTIVRNTTYSYRVQATSATLSPSAWSNTAQVVTPDFPLAPTTLTAVFQSGPQVSLNWTDNATNETGFIIQRAPDGVTFADIGTAPVRGGTGSVTFLDTTVMLPNTTYTYRVAAVNGTVGSAWSNTAQATTGNFPLPPTLVSLTATRVGTTANDRVRVVWSDVAGETGYTVQRSTNATFTSSLVTANFAANVTNYTTGNLPRNITYYFRVRATSAVSPSVWSNVMSVLTP